MIDVRAEAEKIVRQRDKLAPDNVLVGDVVALCTRVAEEAKEEAAALPICPKCQQGYVCEHCGEPIGDYYAATRRSKEKGDG